MSKLLPLLLLACACGGSAARESSSSAEHTSGAAAPSELVLVNRDHRGVAIGGYDPVAYFVDRRPVEGRPEIRAVHHGATYYFATEEHRWEFLRDPDHFAPAYGGYCGYAASIERLSPTSPLFWQIVDDRLVLQHNQHAYDLFNQALNENVAKADRNWPRLTEHNALPSHNLVNVDSEGVAIGGYDPISYFEGTPARGSAEHAARFGGATYWFTSGEHRATFEREPSRYAPAFGGFCGYAASIGRIRPVTPSIYQIIDDRLVLQHSQEAYDLFNRDPNASLAQADQRWPDLVARAGL